MIDQLRQALHRVQDGRCGICGTVDVLDTDHDHTTSLVRGLLCRACNLEEGRHGNQCEDAQRCPICRWRIQPAVALVGWTCRYLDPPQALHPTPLGCLNEIGWLTRWTPTQIAARNTEGEDLAMAALASFRQQLHAERSAS